MKTAINYTIFALLATLANLLSQSLWLSLGEFADSLFSAVMVGTVVGLIVKYLLDKHFIFQYVPSNPTGKNLTFVKYACMGGATTLLFWGFEFSFDYVFQTPAMRYAGGALGLGIGYYLKYHLDKRFVFVKSEG